MSKKVASELLKAGILKGLVSEQRRNGWPQNIWAVYHDLPFEAQLENSETGEYHGYPLQHDDDFRNVVMEEWRQR